MYKLGSKPSLLECQFSLSAPSASYDGWDHIRSYFSSFFPMPIPASSYILISSLSLFVHPFVLIHTERIQRRTHFLACQPANAFSGEWSDTRSASHQCKCHEVDINYLLVHNVSSPQWYAINGRGQTNERTLTLRANEAPVQPLAQIWKLAECRGIHVPY